jgi:hypothetical protein
MIKGSNFKDLWHSSNYKVLFAFTALHLIFIVIFDKVTAFAPDEINYIGVFSNLYKSNFSLDGYLGWQPDSVNALRVIYFPAKLLEVVGFSDFYAVRLLAVFYSILSLYLLLKMSPEERILKLPIRFWLVGAYLVPSLFLWSSLGLRESFIFFSLILIFYLLTNPQNLRFWVQFLLLAAASTFFLLSKVYLYALLLICLVSSALILIVLKRIFQVSKLKLMLAFLIPLLFFPNVATTMVAGAKGMLEVKVQSPTVTGTGTPTVTGTGTATGTATGTGTGMYTSRGQTLHDLNQQLGANQMLSWLASTTGIKSYLEERVEASYLPAGSAEQIENFTQLQTQSASLRNPQSLFVGAFNFLFVPTPFVDNGSFFLNAQSYESFIWYLFYLIFTLLLVGLLFGRIRLNLVTVSSTLFTLGFIMLSALVEINDGTSVRHRAILLIGILLMLATFRRKESTRIQHLNSNF